MQYEFKHLFRMTKRTFQILSGSKSSLTYLSAVNNQNILLACEAAPDLLQLHMDVRVSPIDPLLTIHKSCIISVFLYVLRENTEQRGTGIENRGRNGQMERPIFY